jgi:hypothetical protein
MSTNSLEKFHQFFSGETQITRTILVSSFTVIGVCILLYFIYILLGDFFATIFFSVIISMAIKPTKELILLTMTDHIANNKYSILNCYLFQFLGFITEFVMLICNWLVFRTRSSKMFYLFTNLKITDYIGISCIVYIILTKIEMNLTITLFINILLFDIFIRLIFDTLMLIFSILKNTNLSHLVYERNKFNDTIHSILSISLIILFIGLICGVIIFSIWLCYIDFKSIVTIINDNNQQLSKYLNEIIPENIKSYYENDLTYNNVYMKLKMFEDFLNITEAEHKISGLRNSNHTIWGKQFV